jgi:predicted nicotinamide N-methyase
MPAGPKRRTPPQERQVYGLTMLHSSHPEVRRLQHDAVRPSLHGHKVWPTSFVLMDYLHQRGVPPQARVLELGCGWGLVGISCAKTFQAQVTGLDADAAVFPYLQLHAQHNGVHVATRQGTFADLTPLDLAAFELIVGADICFWEELVDPLYQLIRHSVAAGVAEILLADPSRPPFDELCARCVQHGDAEVLDWAMTKPIAESGRILRVVGDA